MADEREPLLADDVEGGAVTTTTRQQSSRLPWSSSWRLALAVAASVCLVAGVGVISYIEHQRQSIPTTKGVWSGSLSRVSWNPSSGFSFKYESYIDAYMNRAKPAGQVIEDSIRKYYPQRISPTSRPFDIFYTIRDEPVTKCFESKYNADRKSVV